MFLKAVRRLFAIAVFLAVVIFLVLRTRSPFSHESPRSNGHADRHESPRPRSGRRHSEKPQEPQTGGTADTSGVICETQYFADWKEPSEYACSVQSRRGFPVPDPRCTPGGVNPSITLAILQDPSWRTRAVRNCASSEAQKHIAYRWYTIQKPRVNSNQNQVCELDHLVPLELGGADGLGNIWPECGPDDVTLNERYFKKKDHVENYLAEQVKSGRIPLDAAQRGIASDWTQYLDQAEAWCSARGRC